MRTIKNILLSLAVMLGFGVSATFAGGVEYKAIVEYGENLQFPMPGIIADLYDSSGEFVATTTTGDDGIFTFQNLNEGESYSVHFSTELDPSNVDLADAFLLLKYLNKKVKLSALQLRAADVDGNSKVNHSDFAFIVSKKILRDKEFPAGDWQFPVWPFTASSELKSTKALAGPDGPITIVSTGDISTDVPPVIKNSLTDVNKVKEFVYNENQYELILPLSFVNSQKVYGLGIEMAFNNLDVEIIDINSNFNTSDYIIDGNAIKFYWVSDGGESFAANQDFLKLKVRLNSMEDVNAILCELGKSQFVGEDGNLLQNVQLNMPALKKSLITDISIGNPYPNPGNQEINFVLNQLYATNVEIEIFNLAGQLVKQISISPKNNKITISTSDLPNGSYLCSLTIDTDREVKLINVQH